MRLPRVGSNSAAWFCVASSALLIIIGAWMLLASDAWLQQVGVYFIVGGALWFVLVMSVSLRLPRKPKL